MLRRYVLRATSHASRILPNARAAAKSPSEAKQRRSLITGVEFLGKAVPIVVAKVVDQLMATSASVDLTKLLKRAFAALLNPLDLGPQHESLSGVGLLPRKGVFEVSDLLKNPGRRLYQIVGPSNSGKTFAVKTLVHQQQSSGAQELSEQAGASSSSSASSAVSSLSSWSWDGAQPPNWTAALYVPLRTKIALTTHVLQCLSIPPAMITKHETSMAATLKLLDRLMAANAKLAQKPVVFIVDDVQTCLLPKPSADAVSLIAWLLEQSMNGRALVFLIASEDCKKELQSVAGVSSRLSTIEFGYPTLDARKEELQKALDLKPGELREIGEAFGGHMGDLQSVNETFKQLLRDDSKPQRKRPEALKAAIDKLMEMYQSRLDDAVHSAPEGEQPLVKIALARLAKSGHVSVHELHSEHGRQGKEWRAVCERLAAANLARREGVGVYHAWSEGVRSAYHRLIKQDAELKPAQEDKAAAGAKSQGKKKRKKGRR